MDRCLRFYNDSGENNQNKNKARANGGRAERSCMEGEGCQGLGGSDSLEPRQQVRGTVPAWPRFDVITLFLSAADVTNLLWSSITRLDVDPRGQFSIYCVDVTIGVN